MPIIQIYEDSKTTKTAKGEEKREKKMRAKNKIWITGRQRAY